MFKSACHPNQTGREIQEQRQAEDVLAIPSSTLSGEAFAQRFALGRDQTVSVPLLRSRFSSPSTCWLSRQQKEACPPRLEGKLMTHLFSASSASTPTILLMQRFQHPGLLFRSHTGAITAFSCMPNPWRSALGKGKMLCCSPGRRPGWQKH